MKIEQANKELFDLLIPLYGEGEARSIARIVFEDVFGTSRQEGRRALNPEDEDRYLEIRDRLLKHEPVQYVLGEADFYGLKFKVDKNVLIPRAETEELVHLALESCRQKLKVSAIDIGAGSGCIAITLKKKRPAWEVHGVDVSPEALKIAADNARRNQVKVSFFECNFLNRKTWPKLKQYDLIISNPPYIPLRERRIMPENVLKYEPQLALFVDDSDPLIFYRLIAEFAGRNLSPEGMVLVETNEFNAGEVFEIFQAAGLIHVELIRDMSGKDRMVKAEKGPAYQKRAC